MSHGAAVLLGIGIFAVFYAVVITIQYQRNKRRYNK